MNSLAVIFLASSLLVSALGQLDLSCAGLCNTNCNAIDTACRLIPGLTQICDTNAPICTGVCDTTCPCLDTCQARCAGDFADCVQGGNPVVDGTLCLATQSVCQAFCFPSCGVKIGQGALANIVRVLG